MLCCWVQYVEIYTEQRTFADDINFCFHLKKTSAKSYQLLRETYGKHVPSQDTCERWFHRFKSDDFDTRQEGRKGTWKIDKRIEDVELQVLLDEDDT